jgi:hypothetical protein
LPCHIAKKIFGRVMPRKPRIEILSYYHIINRGVEQRVIFKKSDDYEQFEELMCFYTKVTILHYTTIARKLGNWEIGKLR